MAGSTFGTIFKVTTWGESHGAGVGVVVDGCPAGLPLNEEDIHIASLAGLLHDIGRFNQIVRYHNYSDGDIFDHATEGVKILFDDGLINKFDFTDKEKEIIRFSILNHNKFLMDECLDEDILKHAKLIRDVDKLDIVYLFCRILSNYFSNNRQFLSF